MKRKLCFTSALAIAAALPAVSANAADTLNCAALAASLSYPATIFTESSDVAAGTLKTAGQPIGAHCLLKGRMHERLSPVDGKTYAIGFEMRLPQKWNERYYYQANGGIDGSVVTATGNTSGGGPLTSALLQGFAVISSDAGHNGSQNPTFGIDPQARLDYGYQAVAKLTPLAKAVIRAAYGHGPAYSYIGGCSNGGRHTMVAASRIPEQYDGFLVGSPGFNLPKAAVANIYGAQQYATVATNPADLSTAWTATERQLVSSKVLARCDLLDGLADGMVQNVAACQKAFDLDRDVPTCAGARDGTCLSAAQKLAIGNIFAGPEDRHGRPMYSTFPYDAGHGASGTAFWEFFAPLVLDSGAVGFVFGTPPQDPTTFNGPVFSLTSNVDTLYRSIFVSDRLYTESGMSFMTPPHPTQLNGLRRSGGRMIAYHGVSDAIFSIDDTTRWYTELTPRDYHSNDEHSRSPGDFVQLFHVPGMNHCSGGPSTDQFDMLSALVAWVEKGQAPERVTATARGAGNPGGVNADLASTTSGWAANRTRPLCAYPRIAIYKGGDVESAASFECRMVPERR